MMTLVSSFQALLQSIAMTMTAPGFESFVLLLTGWVYTRRHTVTGLIVAAQAVGVKHHPAFHRLFASARWSRDALGLAVFGLIEPWSSERSSCSITSTTKRAKCPSGNHSSTEGDSN